MLLTLDDPEKGRGIDNEYAYNRADPAPALILEVEKLGWNEKAAELLVTKDG